ncbi:MAG TPA: choice-of-anchor tandem repeat GloVer-containing protein [Candidatus Acidoferrum sp.]|nr:choice-of-anchor tandem repeat GloVer-containing protein [Candidatus Acidoferrum sp.]
MRNPFFQSALIAGCGLAVATQLSAQTFTTLQTSSGGSQAGLVSSGNVLYGTSFGGGRLVGGTVFAINSDGTGFTNLYEFSWVRVTSGPGDPLGPGTNSNGAFPRAGLVLSGNTLYGITRFGGVFGEGVIFRINTDGTGFTNLHSLATSEGTGARAGLILSGNTLYGAGQGGGNFGRGALFAVNTDGTGFTNLHHFNLSDGEQPSGTLALSGGTLYGTTYGGAASGAGAIFKINTDGTGFTNLRHFIEGSTANNGGAPFAGLALSGSVLYGVTTYGGISGAGTIFRMNTDGTGFNNLHQFRGLDGANAKASLLLRGNTLFGSTSGGGSNNNGTIFAVQTDGSGFTNLHVFAVGGSLGNGTNIGGATPYCDLTLEGNTLYGTTQWGGAAGNGTVFSISLPIPQLKIVSSAANVVLTWPANSPGFSLEYSTSFGSSAEWSPVLPGSTVVDGQHTVTHPISDSRNFYRLSQ